MPSTTAWDLVDGAHQEVAEATEGQTVTMQRPFPVTVTPAGLV